MGAEGGSWGRWARRFGVLGPCIVPPPQSSLFFLCITSSCLPADVENFLCSPLPPFSGQPGCHGNCILLGLGVERAGSRGEEMVTLDSGLCLSPCFCFCISSCILAPPQPPRGPWHPGFLSAFLLSIFLPWFSVSTSCVSHTHRCLSTFSWISIPPAPTPARSGLATIPSTARPGPHLPQNLREAWPGHAHLPTRQQELESRSSQPQRPPCNDPPPAPMEGVPARSPSSNLPPASLIILLFTLTSHLLPSPPPARTPPYILTPMLIPPLLPPPTAKEKPARPGEAPSAPHPRP